MHELRNQIFSIVRSLWKHRWLGLIVAWVVAGIGFVVVLSKAEKYEATARIFVDTQSILKPLMSGLAVQPNVDQQIAMLSRTLISRPNVEKLIQMTGLEKENTSKDAHEGLVDHLSRTLEIRTAGRDNLYQLSFRDGSPEKATKVIESLVTIFVQSSQGGNREDSASAKVFIDDQIKAYVAKLEEAETRLKEFKIKNIDTQAADGKDMVGQLNDVSAQMSQARLELREAANARDALRTQLAAENARFAEANSRKALSESSQALATPEIDSRIDAQKRNLDALLQRYTEQHPDVISARRLIVELEDMKRKQISEMRKSGAAIPHAASNTSPAYLEINRLLATTEAQVASLSARVGEYESRMTRARALMKSAPQVEAEMAQLNRDYEVNKKNYNDLVARRESAALSGNMESAAGVAEFRLIDPPRASQKPVAPNRQTLLPLALLFAIGSGVAAAYVASQLRSVFFDARALKDVVGLPVLGTVTLVKSPQALLDGRADLKKFLGASGALVVLFVLGIIVTSLLSSRAG
jgi:polysaccharide chain length determinant protein (PEP-CTERM system associated)